MEIFLRLSLAAVALAMTGCVAMPPMRMDPQTPQLSVAAKRRFKLAVVVPDPMPYDIYYSGQACKMTSHCYKRDMTAEMRSAGFPLESAMSRIVSDTFSQGFSGVVVVRDLPQPGQYDGVVTLSIGKILNQEHVVLTGETSDITAEWTMSVLDAQNREILRKTGVSPMHNYSWSALSPRATFVKGVLANMSLILTELSQEWGSTLYSLDFKKV